MIVNKNNYALLLVALVAMPVQAAPRDTLNALLARMQNNVIGRHLMTKRAATLVGLTAVGVGVWWWLKNRQQEQRRGVEAEKEEASSPVLSTVSAPPTIDIRSFSSKASSVQEQSALQVAGQSVPLAKKVTPFFVKMNMSSWKELPGILQNAQGSHGLDLSKTAIALDYDGTLVHDVYLLNNSKELNLLLYEYYDVNPELFKNLKEEYGFSFEQPLASSILSKYSDDYSDQERIKFQKTYRTHTFPSDYMEDQKQMEQIIGDLVTRAAFVGICSRSSYTAGRGNKVAQLGLKGDEDHWAYIQGSKFAEFNALVNNNKRQNLISQEIDTYILIDNDQSNINSFLREAQKENINALGVYYTRVDDMVTADALREEIKYLSPEYDAGAGIGASD